MWRAACPSCGMPGLTMKKVFIWLVLATLFVAAAYELSHLAILIGSGGE